MGGFSSAVQWWEEWQLRILVLGSLVIQCYLAFFAPARKKHIRPLLRFSIWLAYLGGDALAIYALATLFNRQRKVRYTSVDGSHNLEVFWAPILLMHLGGQINISAYNIEDNELWRRHIVTAVSQVAVALFVFCKSWSPSADRRLLAAAVLLFILGVFKCFERPMALKRSSFNSLISSFNPSQGPKNINREVELEEYIQEARDFGSQDKHPVKLTDGFEFKIFLDSTCSYTYHLTKLKSLCLQDDKPVYGSLCVELSDTFNLIYSKAPVDGHHFCGVFCSLLLWYFTMILPIVPIILFHTSHKQAYRRSDVRVTFSLLYTTYFLEISSSLTMISSLTEWQAVVAQHSLIGSIVHNRKHKWLIGTRELKPCNSSREITNLVQSHFRNGWMKYIKDIESYWMFSDIRGHLTLEQNGCEEILGGSLEGPFEENIILWHLATDFCFHHMGTPSDHECAKRSREISNYMLHLLFANPEMLIPGSRRTLFTDSYNELETILQGEDLSMLEEKQITKKIIEKVGSKEGSVHDSWVLAQKLMELGEEKMWEVIKGVWIEMLCFSAGRCRGYLHAKSLGSGGEYLTLVTLLMSHAGLETFAERQQRVKLRLTKEERLKIAKQRIQEAASKKKSTGDPSTDQGTGPTNEGENAATPSASEVRVVPLKEDDDAATMSASQGDEGVAPAPSIEIVVSR